MNVLSKSIKIILPVLIGLSSCKSNNTEEQTVDILFHATDSVSLFAEHVVSSKYHVRDFTLSPDGDELYYSVQHPQTGFAMIVGSKKTGDQWTKPEMISFSGNFTDFEPVFSPDGKRLYFSSNRPIGESLARKDFDIWFVEKTDEGWGEPQNVGSPVNSEGHEFYPSLAANGNIYFTAQRENGIGREDIFMSRFVDGAYTAPIALDTAVNSNLSEFNAFVSPEEDYIIFTSWGRKDDRGRGDLYISFKDSLDNWTPAKNLGEGINSSNIDYCPFVSADRKYFFFTSARMDTEVFSKGMNWEKFEEINNSPLNGSGNIYILSFDELLKLK